jgi:hypothetical protein
MPAHLAVAHAETSPRGDEHDEVGRSESIRGDAAPLDILGVVAHLPVPLHAPATQTRSRFCFAVHVRLWDGLHLGLTGSLVMLHVCF